MALVPTVTKKSVVNPQSKLYIITFNLTVKENEVDVINQDFMCEYRTGDDVADKVAQVREKMQAVITAYKESQAIYASVALDNAVTSIQGGLNV